MAQFEHLPIYKKAYDLTLYFEKIVRNFRVQKYVGSVSQTGLSSCPFGKRTLLFTI